MLSDQLKQLRKRDNLTQQQVADLLGIPRGTYAHFEIGKRRPNLETLGKIASLYKVTLDYIFDRDYTVDIDENLPYDSEFYTLLKPQLLKGLNNIFRQEDENLEDWYDLITTAIEYDIAPKELMPILEIVTSRINKVYD